MREGEILLNNMHKCFDTCPFGMHSSCLTLTPIILCSELKYSSDNPGQGLESGISMQFHDILS